MKVFYCNNFEGHWPVGAAAVVVAKDMFSARDILSKRLSDIGLSQDISIDDLEEIDLDVPSAYILCNGDY